MKTLSLNLFASLCIILTSLSVQAQSKRNAGEYMQEIVNALNSTKNETWQYLKAVTRGKGAKKVESKRQNLLNELKKAKYEVQRIGKYKSDDTLKNAAVNYLNLSYSVLKEDFDKILDMEEVVEQSYDLMEAYLLAKEMASEKLQKSFEEVIIAQTNFAKKHNINILDSEDDKTTKNIKSASEILKYYNQIFLIFFKSNKQEAYVLDALSRNDIVAFEQNINTLITFSQEGIEKIENIESFNADNNLRIAAVKILSFYNQEAEKEFPKMSDFFIIKDNFEKTKKSFDSINEKNRNQQDIDQYNQAVSEYNKAAQSANKNIEALNKERNNSLNEWNKAVDKFFNDHSN